jgi:hypothetical protein
MFANLRHNGNSFVIHLQMIWITKKKRIESIPANQILKKEKIWRAFAGNRIEIKLFFFLSFSRGVLLQNQQNYKAAVESFQKAVHFRPSLAGELMSFWELYFCKFSSILLMLRIETGWVAKKFMLIFPQKEIKSLLYIHDRLRNPSIILYITIRENIQICFKRFFLERIAGKQWRAGKINREKSENKIVQKYQIYFFPC